MLDLMIHEKKRCSGEGNASKFFPFLKGEEVFLKMLVLCPSAERQLATFTWCLVGWPAITSSPMMNSRTERWCSKTCNTKKKKISSTTNKGI